MKKIINTISKAFQKVGPAIMPVIAVLPIAGFLLGIGSAMQQAVLISALPFLGNGAVQSFAILINAIGNLILGNLGLFFAVGIAMNLSGKKGMAAFSAVLAFLTMNKTIEIILQIDADKLASSNAYATVLGVNTLQTGVFGGLVVGIVVYLLYKRFHEVQFPQAFSFFQGERFVPIISTLAAIALGFVMILVWPPIQGVFDAFTNWLIHTPYRFLAVFMYGFIMRLVQAFGLQHLIYPFFYFQMGSYTSLSGTIVTGESSIFFAQMADGVPITVGGFMTGSYVNSIMCCAVALAIYKEAKPARKKYVKGIMLGAAITVAFTGVSEPIEFAYLLISPFLWFVNSFMVGLGYAITDLLQIRLGTGLAGNIIDYVLYGMIPQANNFLLLIPVGIAFFFAQYFLFRFFIRKFNIKTPGREDDEEIEMLETDAVSASQTAVKMVEYLGGNENIVTLENCFTRVRASVKDRSIVQKNKFKALGAQGYVEPGDHGVQVIFGPASEKIVSDMKQVMNGIQVKDEPLHIQNTKQREHEIMGKEQFVAAVNGTLISLEDVPDPVFSQKMMGEGFAIIPSDGHVVSPVNGSITTIFPTWHAIGITSDLGKEIIVHMGLDTVELNKEGFQILVQEKDIVEAGTPLANMNLDILADRGKSAVTPIVISNAMGRRLHMKKHGSVSAGEELDITID